MANGAVRRIHLGTVKGEPAKINGQNTINIREGSGIQISQVGTELTVSTKDVDAKSAQIAYNIQVNPTDTSNLNIWIEE